MLAVQGSAATETETHSLAKASQNPVASLIQVPFENNYNRKWGPNNSNQNVLNVKPVVPIKIGENWNLINRAIVPLVSQPGIPGGPNRQNGIGDTTYQAFFSPSKPGEWIWGLGPQVQIPTHTDEVLGNEHWGAGPAAVVLRMPGHWVYGALFAQMWDVGSSGNDASEADNDDEWTIPLGGGVGRVFHWGKQAINARMAYYYNVEKPRFAAQWDFQLTFTLMYPKK